MDLEFDFKGFPIGGVITNCKYFSCVLPSHLLYLKAITLNPPHSWTQIHS